MLKMVLSPNALDLQTGQETDLAEEADEPPDHHLFPSDVVSIRPSDSSAYLKSPPALLERKESLLTRALQHGSDQESPNADTQKFSLQDDTLSYLQSNASGHSTAELTSDGDLTSPPLSNTPSPPLPSQFTGVDALILNKAPATDPSESAIETNLGRKRCISFACARKVDGPCFQKAGGKKVEANPDKVDCLQRRPTLTFACPTRGSETRAPQSPSARASRLRPYESPPPCATAKVRPGQDFTTRNGKFGGPQIPQLQEKPGSIHMTGLGRFKPGEETRFHEFASSFEEDDEWVAQLGEFKDKITLNDCMQKENAIRKLGEEAEAEAIEEEEQAEGDMDEEGGEEDESTVHDFSSDDGNETDNEAGFADSDESDDESEYGFWTPSATTAATTFDNLDFIHQAVVRRNSNTSVDSLRYYDTQKWLPAPARRENGRRYPSRHVKVRPGTPDLPDSTDFVCGTLDEDRHLEVEYISCMEERRRSKHIPIPQDIDPSFPTTDPEDNEDLDEINEEDIGVAIEISQQLGRHDDEGHRGRRQGQPPKISPRMSPKRIHSPAPHLKGHSPKRLRSPAPLMKQRPACFSIELVLPVHPEGVNITGLVQRPNCYRTKSLPRTPNPFFTSMENLYLPSRVPSMAGSPERGVSRSREMHTRGPIDIIQGLERKRQKRKEKYNWRQHCRKAAKEQTERRHILGKGAERMKELGLEVAERFRAYGVGQDAQLVLSV